MNRPKKKPKQNDAVAVYLCNVNAFTMEFRLYTSFLPYYDDSTLYYFNFLT